MLKDMKTHTHLKPGQKGTRRLVEQFGDKLLCVRYRYDEIRQVRMKTVEIIVDERPINPNLQHRDKDIVAVMETQGDAVIYLSLIHISEPTRRTPISYAVFCLKKKK